MDEYSEVFQEKIGTLKSTKAKLPLKEGYQPKFSKARTVPYALKPKVDAELKRLESEEILEKMTFSDWATPIDNDNDNDLFKVEKRRKWLPNLPSQRLMLKALDINYYNYIYTYKNLRILELLIDSYNIETV